MFLPSRVGILCAGLLSFSQQWFISRDVLVPQKTTDHSRDWFLSTILCLGQTNVKTTEKAWSRSSDGMNWDASVSCLVRWSPGSHSWTGLCCMTVRTGQPGVSLVRAEDSASARGCPGTVLVLWGTQCSSCCRAVQQSMGISCPSQLRCYLASQQFEECCSWDPSAWGCAVKRGKLPQHLGHSCIYTAQKTKKSALGHRALALSQWGY